MPTPDNVRAVGERLRELEAKATKAPWEFFPSADVYKALVFGKETIGYIAGLESDADAELIRAMRNDLSIILDALEKANSLARPEGLGERCDHGVPEDVLAWASAQHRHCITKGGDFSACWFNDCATARFILSLQSAAAEGSGFVPEVEWPEEPSEEVTDAVISYTRHAWSPYGLYKAMRAAHVASLPAAPPSGFVRDDVPEGCTPVDMAVLRQANLEFATENQRLRTALRFYARGDHWACDGAASNLWDTVSGEPQSWYWRENDNDDAEGVEDGRIAKRTLLNQEIDWEGDEPMPIEGEPEHDVALAAPPSGFVRVPEGESSTAYNAAVIGRALKELVGPVERERLEKLPWARSLANDLVKRIVNLRVLLAASQSAQSVQSAKGEG